MFIPTSPPINTIHKHLTISFRPITTYKATPDAEQELLKKQRINRPLSPHLEIYEFGMTMTLSSLHRLSGVAMAFAFYGFTVSYAVLPAIGYSIDAASLAAAFGSLPIAAKLAVKTVAAAPFAFHLWNGFRHLIWDTANYVSKKGVYKTGYPVIALTAVTIAGFLLM